MERRKQRVKNLVFVSFLLFFIWIFIQFLAPFALPRDSVSDLSGIVGFSDNENVIQEMSFPWNIVYSSGDRLCHQRADRSFFLNGNEMPYCSRCTAIWFGLTIGLGFMVLYTLELNEKFLITLIAVLIPIGTDGIGQFLGLWESSNIIRILTGLPAGIICGVAIGIILDELRNLPIFHRSNIFFFFFL